MSWSARHGIGAVVTLTAIIALSACSSPSEVTSSATGANSSSVESGDAQQAFDVAYEGEIGTPPRTATTPPPDVDLWVVSCGEATPGCSIPAAAAVEAAEAVGWDTNVCDGALAPPGWGTCVRQAVSAGADVIIPIGIDCASIQQPFQEARDAGVAVIGGGGVDCDASGGDALWATERLQIDGLDSEALYRLMGSLAADWLIGQTDGQAQVLALEYTEPVWGPWLNAGLGDRLASCAGCSVVGTMKFGASDLASLPQLFSTALLQAPDANAVFFPVGGFLNAGLAQSVVDSGRSADLAVVATLGIQPSFDLIRSDAGVDAVVAFPQAWGSWGSVDTAIRVLNGEDPLVQGDGAQVVDATHNMPSPGAEFDAGVDYRSAYREAWGL